MTRAEATARVVAAARECEQQKATEPWTYPGGEEARARFNQGCDWSRDAIRALATGGRG